MRKCSKCKETKLREGFYVQRSRRDGLTSQCKECVLAAVNKYAAANRDTVREGNRKAGRKFREANLERERARGRAAYKADAERWCKRHAEWQKANPHKHCATQARRRAKKMCATPAWANQRYIAIWYQLAAEESKRLGEPVEVDHIVPLTHSRVCGLHTEHNLQLLRASDNRSKSNRFWPDV